MADGKAGEGAHHENVSLVQQQGGDGVRAHAAKLILRKREKFDFDAKNKDSDPITCCFVSERADRTKESRKEEGKFCWLNN